MPSSRTTWRRRTHQGSIQTHSSADNELKNNFGACDVYATGRFSTSTSLKTWNSLINPNMSRKCRTWWWGELAVTSPSVSISIRCCRSSADSLTTPVMLANWFTSAVWQETTHTTQSRTCQTGSALFQWLYGSLWGRGIVLSSTSCSDMIKKKHVLHLYQILLWYWWMEIIIAGWSQSRLLYS